MKCPNCQAELPDNARFCNRCGKSLETELICRNCHHPNPPGSSFCLQCGHTLMEQAPGLTKPRVTEPTSFANGRYQVKRKLGEGGKKKVYLVHDTKLDRDVAFALIKTENIDEDALKRVTREAQAMGKLGDHPNIVSIFDMGDQDGQPFIVQPYMPDDVEGLIEKAQDHKLPLDQAIKIAQDICQGLEFAHSKGIVHRDIKPGNVLLSDEGKARINDFGLALMINVSRLTHDSMMVGTFFYMPPEQAMPGGEVTSKADLYSLGAMMYEMVTGRPPFVGDDYVAIIRQHIDTPPVSPTWHRADLPPAFESLIMLLLEKDPQKRPASAKDVYKALESIEKGDIKEPAVETQTRIESPLYRRIFVGRENELKQLQSAFDIAISGQGALVMVVGEPGIGKTATCEQLATFVTIRGGKTLWGHCYEEGSLSLPYLAFIEAMRSYILDRDADDLKKELGAGATDVARIVSEIREKLHVEPREAQNPEEDRYRLMQAVTSFLTNAANIKPMLVILEDLHDSDKGTLEMLTYISRNLSNTRLLIIGTYRDIEVDRNHPLSAALAELRRVSSFGRVLLRGLNINEVRRMLESLMQEDIPVGLAEAVHRQTEGNPLFVQEVVRYLTEEKLLKHEGGRLQTSGDTTLEMSIPEGLRDVIGKRLSALSEECNHLLSVASVIGREFDLETLKAVVGINADVFVNTLKEAVRLSVLQERSQVGIVRYSFTHAFFRQTLYEEMIAPQRLQLHQQVARALETQYSIRLEEHAAELAEHFSQSTDPADLAKAVVYGEMAAKRAEDVYAYSEAVRLLEQALKVQEILDPGDKEKRCDLLLDLCNELLLAVDPRRVYDVEAPAALSIADSLGDASRSSRACRHALYAGFYNLEWSSPLYAEWAERADRYAQPGTVERALADMYLGLVKRETGERESGYRLCNQALDLARRIGDSETLWHVAIFLIMELRAPQYVEQRMQLAEEVWSGSHVGHTILTAPLMQWVGDTFLVVGQRKHVEEVFAEMLGLAQRTGNFTLEWTSAFQGSIMAIADGRLEEAVDMAESIRTGGRETVAVAATVFYASVVDTRARSYLGASLETSERELRGLTFLPEGDSMIFCLLLAHMGRKEEVSEILMEKVVKRPGIGTPQDETTTNNDAMLLEASVLVSHREAAGLMLDRLSGKYLYTAGVFNPTCIPRHLGDAATLLEKYDEAREHYKEAIRVCTEMRFRPEFALSRLGLAELLLDHYPDQKAEALEHLDFSIKEFREMKMQPSLERALRRKEILGA